MMVWILMVVMLMITEVIMVVVVVVVWSDGDNFSDIGYYDCDIYW